VKHPVPEDYLLHQKKKLFIFPAIMFAQNYIHSPHFIPAPIVLPELLLRLAR
jgi:hypothetical protein